MDSTTPAETPEIKLHFLDYWRVIRLRRSLIITVFLLCVITSSFLTYWLPKQYASTVRIEVQKDSTELNIAPNAIQSQGWDPYYLTTQFKIITSWNILYQVITNMNLTHVLPSDSGEPDWTIDQTFQVLSRKVSVDQTRGTSLIEIAVRSTKPEMAADIANKIAQTYKDFRLNQWQSNRKGGIESLEGQIQTNETALAALKIKLDQMRTSNNIPELEDNPGANVTIYAETIRMLESRRIEAQIDFHDHSTILDSLLKLDTNKTLASALPTAFGSRSVDPQLLLAAERVSHSRDALTEAQNSGYGTNHPSYITAQKAFEEASTALTTTVQGIMEGLKALVSHDQDVLSTIEELENKAKSESNTEAAKNRPYFDLKREVEETTRTLSELKREVNLQRAELNQPLKTIVVVHDPARPDKHAVSPKPFFIIPVGVIMGLLVGMGLAFFIEYLDTSVKTIDDVERSLQAPVLGVIPQNVGNLMEDGPESPHAEAYRVLRTNILFGRKNDSWNTVSVLSGGAGEGKTTTLFNLAVVFAQNNQRVLVVDSDLRRPSVHRMLKANNAMGLTDLLLNKQVTVEQVIQKTKLPTLDFLASGKLPSSSMSILGSVSMKDTIRELKKRYDWIFFDSPPLLGVSDASILASEMDMVLQVIQYRRYPQPMTLRAKQMIQKVGGNLMGLVLNNINMSQDENYYYYSGYYEYEYRSQQNDATVVQLSDAAKAAKADIKQKY